MSIKINEIYYVLSFDKIRRNYYCSKEIIHINKVNWSRVSKINFNEEKLYGVNNFLDKNINDIIELSPELTHLNLLKKFRGHCYNNIFIVGNDIGFFNSTISNTKITIYRLVECNISKKNKYFILNNLPLQLEELYIFWNANDWLITHLISQLNLPINLKKIILQMEAPLYCENFATELFIKYLYDKLKIPFNCNLQINIKLSS